MNPRIKQLAIKAGLYVDVNGQPWPRNMNGEDIEGAYSKFAELIVLECVDKVEDAANASPELFGVALDILDHFGVEE